MIKIKNTIDSRKYANYDFKQWKKTYDSLSLLKLAHSLEKGMGLPRVKRGFGVEKANKLIKNLEFYQKNGGDVSDFAYLEALKILEEYISFQARDGIVLQDINERLLLLLNMFSNDVKKVYNELNAGTVVVDKNMCIHDFDLYEYLKDRHSIRDYDTSLCVTDEEVKRAIKVASLAPSACNRQPSKIYYSLDREKTIQIGKIIPGNRGYEDAIPYYAVITVDRSVFDPSEMYQWFVNGGIFTAFFVEGLYEQNIGSCIFQFPFNDSSRSNEIRSILGAKQSEAICSVVSFGKYKDSFKCLYAQRKNCNDLSVRF